MPSLVPEVATQIQDAEAGSVVGPISLGGAHGISEWASRIDPLRTSKTESTRSSSSSLMEDFVVSIEEAAPSFNPALLQGLEQLPEGMKLPEGTIMTRWTQPLRSPDGSRLDPDFRLLLRIWAASARAFAGEGTASLAYRSCQHC